MKLPKPQNGQSLVELLLAVGVFMISVATIGVLVLDAYVSSRQGVERTQAVLLAREGLEATRSIRDADFDNLTAGTHGIALSGGHWTFSGTSDIQDRFTRQIIITDIDADTRRVQSKVSWQISEVRRGSVVLIGYLTDWSQTQGQAGELDVDTGSVHLDNSGRELRGIKIENVGAGDIVIDKITVWWDKGRRIEEITIDNTTVWSSKGPGSPRGKQQSGTELDIQNFGLAADSGKKNIDQFKFDGSMTDAGFIILFRMIDGSTKYVSVYVLVEPEGYCSGTATPCDAFPSWGSCEDQDDCSWNPGGCEGTCIPCESLSWWRCRRQGGCRWSWWRRECVGICTPCDTYGSRGTCEPRLGCSWTPGYCSGASTPCGNYSDEVSCKSQDGCHWISPE